MTDWQERMDKAQQVEGYSAPAGNLTPSDLIASGSGCWFIGGTADFRGVVPEVNRTGDLSKSSFEWLTGIPENADDATFCFIGSSYLLPDTIYPFPYARLYANSELLLTINIGEHADYFISGQKCALQFIARRFMALSDNDHRHVAPGGNSGIFRLFLDKSFITPGKPVKLKIEVEPVKENIIAWFSVSPRKDVLSETLKTLYEEYRQFQMDYARLKETMNAIGRQVYADLFPEKIKSEKIIAVTSQRGHFHPPVITALKDGELLLSYREGTDHLGDNGIGVLIRSSDGGRTWGERTVIVKDDFTDHRIVAITELIDGSLLCCDSIDCSYDDKHNYTFRKKSDFEKYKGLPGPLYLLKSYDRGRTWQKFAGPLFAGIRSLEVSKPIVQLPDGRLLMPMYYLPENMHGDRDAGLRFVITVQESNDAGKTWKQVYEIKDNNPPLTGEHSIVRTKSGRLLSVIRTDRFKLAPGMEQPAVIISSDDEGRTWSKPEPVAIPSLGCPPHLLALDDGRVICTYGTRKSPGVIGICVSNDEGRTWDTENKMIVADDLGNWDSTYPSSAQLPDGTIVTAYYNNFMGRYFVAVHRYRI